MVSAALIGFQDGYTYGPEPWIGPKDYDSRLRQWLYDLSAAAGNQAHRLAVRLRLIVND